MTTSSTPPGQASPPPPEPSDRRRESPSAPSADRAEAPPAPSDSPPRLGQGPARIERFPAKLSKKQRKILRDAQRPLDSWERYRAITDVLDEALDLVGLADHKARFAIVIMAALNVVLFFVGIRSDLIKEIPSQLQPFLGIYVLIYVLFALYFFLQAIESLRPRKSQPQVPPVGQTAIEDFPLGIRFYEDILRRELEDYKQAWKEVHMGQLNAELAVQAHALAGINRAKYNALRRLYQGLKIMTMMAVGLVGLAAAGNAVGTAMKMGKASTRGAKIFGTAEPFKNLGVREPSGVASAPNGHFFVIGDEGKLAEFDTDVKRVHEFKVEAQLEDVVFHPPSGLLVLVSESRAELVAFDPVAGQARGRFPIDNAVLGAAPGDRNSGFEGLAFRAEPDRPGGGIFYLTHQRSPAAVLALTFDPAGPPRRLGVADAVALWPLNFEDLTAATYVPLLDRLLVIADAKDRLLVMRTDTGAIEADLPLPGQQQEGIAIDSAGTMWIADDLDKSVLRIKGALENLTAYLHGERNPAAHPGGAGAEKELFPN